MKSNTKVEEEMEIFLPLQRGQREIGGPNHSYRPIFGDVEVVSVCPIEINPRNIGTLTMGKEKDTMVVEVRFCKCKKTLIV
jgi:hypothetical protein